MTAFFDALPRVKFFVYEKRYVLEFGEVQTLYMNDSK
jgi:hypothetical protein